MSVVDELNVYLSEKTRLTPQSIWWLEGPISFRYNLVRALVDITAGRVLFGHTFLKACEESTILQSTAAAPHISLMLPTDVQLSASRFQLRQLAIAIKHTSPEACFVSPLPFVSDHLPIFRSRVPTANGWWGRGSWCPSMSPYDDGSPSMSYHSLRNNLSSSRIARLADTAPERTKPSRLFHLSYRVRLSPMLCLPFMVADLRPQCKRGGSYRQFFKWGAEKYEAVPQGGIF
jgi:hypothetical protein